MRMMLMAGCAALLLGACNDQSGAANETPATADKARVEADVRYLSDDLFEGREAGTRGHELAAKFVAERYRALGFEPGGDDNTFFQNIALRAIKTVAPEGGTLSLSGAGAPSSFTRGADYIVGSSADATSIDIEGQIVFVGFGLVAPEYNRDDYTGLDVEGKIVAYFSGAPKFLNSEERAHYSSTRAQRASERGAVGVITLWTPDLEERFAFQRAVDRLGSVGMRWLDDNGEPFSTAPSIVASASVSIDGAKKLFAGSGHVYDDLVAAADDEAGAVPAFALDIAAQINTRSIHEQTTSPNVIGILPGSDPALRDEYIVLTAHLDHIGMRPTEEEGDDEINNGALDNAAGIASLLEAARLLAQNPPRRSLIFIALTAEEKGLIGSDYYARNPSVPADKIVANINLDMPIITYPFTDVIANGGERSTMYPVVEAAVARANLTFSPDPQPEQGFFTRSDQYSFVKQGVPALNIDVGWANGGEEAQKAFLKDNYHKPGDDADKVDYDALRVFAQVNYEIIRGVGDMDQRPLWVKDDFFARTFGGPMAE